MREAPGRKRRQNSRNNATGERPPFCHPPATVAKGSCRCGPDRCRGTGEKPARRRLELCVRSSGAVRTRDGHLPDGYFLQNGLATSSSPWRINTIVSDFGPPSTPHTVPSLRLPCMYACLPVYGIIRVAGRSTHLLRCPLIALRTSMLLTQRMGTLSSFTKRQTV